MAHTLVQQHQTKSVRELIYFISTCAENAIYIEEFLTQGFAIEKKGNVLCVFCSDGICQLQMNRRFIDASSFEILT